LNGKWHSEGTVIRLGRAALADPLFNKLERDAAVILDTVARSPAARRNRWPR
jgi:hypothetical protein